MVFKYAHPYSQSCDIFQNIVGREIRYVVPLQPVVVKEPF